MLLQACAVRILQLVSLIVCVSGVLQSPAQAQSLTSYSIPAGQLMPYLQQIQTTSLIRIKYEDKPWKTASSRADRASCQLSDQGVLSAIRHSSQRVVEMCEWSLFSPEKRLVAGWLVQRAHWFGDIRMALFVSNPISTDNPFLRVRLRVPSSDNGTAKKDSAPRTHKLGLRLLTLRGPVDEDWRSAFRP